MERRTGLSDMRTISGGFLWEKNKNRDTQKTLGSGTKNGIGGIQNTDDCGAQLSAKR